VLRQWFGLAICTSPGSQIGGAASQVVSCWQRIVVPHFVTSKHGVFGQQSWTL
jgi:hypothetical protein